MSFSFFPFSRIDLISHCLNIESNCNWTCPVGDTCWVTGSWYVSDFQIGLECFGSGEKCWICIPEKLTIYLSAKFRAQG